jgi:drug/metabolite transporter (DMT)-like permease
MTGRHGAALALVSACLFGASTPFAKTLLRDVDPLMLAGLLYLGSGVGLAAVLAARRLGGGWAAPRPPSGGDTGRRSGWPSCSAACWRQVC